MTATLHDMPCPECGHSTMGHDYDAICWGTRDCQCEMSRNEVAQRNHERILAARVGEVVERVEAVWVAEGDEPENMRYDDAEFWHDGAQHALRLVRTALRAADPRTHDTDRHDQPKEPDHMSECPNAGACTRPADCPFCWPPTESEEA